MILGIDEVGRGCWAGPLVVAAVVLGGVEIKGLTDSKALSRKRREQLYDEIMSKASDAGLGWVAAEEIDQIGLSAALRLATKRAVKSVEASFHEIVIDGTVNFLSGTPLEKYVTTMAKADLLVPSVSAASIVAKVSRDRYMAEMDSKWPGYGFSSNVGYGTAAHRSAIEALGVCGEHRLSFDPLAKYRDVGYQDTVEMVARGTDHNTSRIGQLSESVVAEELTRRGHEVIDRNWKNRFCEIDIVSVKDNTYYFTEVKHRRRDDAGDGLEAVTAAKLSQMRYAAKFYAHIKQLDVDMKLLVASTAGNTHDIIDIIEIV